LAFESLHKLQTLDNSALAFVYCDHTIQGEQTATNLVGSLLAQLTNRLSGDHSVVKELLERQASNKLVDLASGTKYIRRICTSPSFSCTRIGTDGLDELLPEHRVHFLDEMASLSRVANIQFLFLARDHSGIQSDVDSSFGGESGATMHFKISGEMTVHDRRLFLLEKLRKDKNGRTFDDALRDLLLDKLAPSDSTCVLQC
jgi:hypothetical protein